MRISDWSSDVCSSDLLAGERRHRRPPQRVVDEVFEADGAIGEGAGDRVADAELCLNDGGRRLTDLERPGDGFPRLPIDPDRDARSEERRGGKECGSTVGYRWSPYH